MCCQMLGKKDSPGPLFYLLDMSRGSLLPGCDCWSVVQNASVAIGRASLTRKNEAGGSLGAGGPYTPC